MLWLELVNFKVMVNVWLIWELLVNKILVLELNKFLVWINLLLIKIWVFLVY